MRKSSLLLVLAFCLAMVLLGFGIVRTDEAPDLSWSKTYGSENNDLAYSIIQTSDGGYALAGSTYSFGTDWYDFWLVKIDSSGNEEWNKTFGGENDDWVHSIIQTSDGGYALAGDTTYDIDFSDIWLVKTDSSGNLQWSKTYGGTDGETAYSIIQTSDGGYALAGYTGSYGAGSDDFWLVKIDSSGNEEWSKTYGGENNDSACSVIQTSDGGYVLAGSTGSYTAGWMDFWLVKTDSSGNEEWNKTFGGEDSEGALSAIQTSDGGYALAGTTYSFSASNYDFWLVKTDSSGNMEWSKIFGGENDDWVRSIIQTSDGGYALVGYTESYGAGERDFWLVKTDSSGNMQWNKTFGSENREWAYSVIQTSDGSYVLAGYTWSYGAGRYDFWLVKTVPEGREIVYVVLGVILAMVAISAFILYNRSRE